MVYFITFHDNLPWSCQNLDDHPYFGILQCLDDHSAFLNRGLTNISSFTKKGVWKESVQKTYDINISKGILNPFQIESDSNIKKWMIEHLEKWKLAVTPGSDYTMSIQANHFDSIIKFWTLDWAVYTMIVICCAIADSNISQSAYQS